MDIALGDIVTVNMAIASETFLQSVKKYHYGMVDLLVDDRAHILWFGNDCYLSYWWSVKALLKVSSMVGHVDEIRTEDFRWIEREVELFERNNPLPVVLLQKACRLACGE